jgi:hypothetical protein
MKPKVDIATRLAELEDLIVQLDCTFADLATSERNGYLSHDVAKVHAEAERIRVARRQG